MPMQRVLDREVILYENFQVVALLDFNQRSRLLIVDQVNGTGHSI